MADSNPLSSTEYEKKFIDACIQGSLEKAESLQSEHTIDVNVTRYGMTPLHYACHGHENIVRFLLKAPGIDINKPNIANETPLHIACRYGYIGVIKVLLNNSDIKLNLIDTNDQTPLHYACKFGHAEVVELLLEKLYLQEIHKEELNRQDHCNKTPLHIACRHGHTAVVKILVNKLDVRLNLIDTDDQTPLHYACKFGHTEIVELLLEKLYLQKILKKELNRQDCHGQTPLQYACENGHEDVVKLLLQTDDINLNKIDSVNETALFTAYEHGYVEVVKLLLDAPGLKIDLDQWLSRFDSSFIFKLLDIAKNRYPQAFIERSHIFEGYVRKDRILAEIINELSDIIPMSAQAREDHPALNPDYNKAVNELLLLLHIMVRSKQYDWQHADFLKCIDDNETIKECTNKEYLTKILKLGREKAVWNKVPPLQALCKQALIMNGFNQQFKNLTILHRERYNEEREKLPIENVLAMAPSTFEADINQFPVTENDSNKKRKASEAQLQQLPSRKRPRC